MHQRVARKPLPRRRLRRRTTILCLTLATCAGFIGFWQRSAAPVATVVQPHVEAKSEAPKTGLHVQPEWPDSVAAAAIGVVGHGVIATYGSSQARPIASIAKVITALTLLDKYPLKHGQPGPAIPITTQDEQRYRDYLAKNGSVIPVQQGISITLRDALEAMMLPSANNIADTAAVWGFGSLQGYTKAANAWLHKHGLRQTVVSGDASGLNPGTVSTPRDLITLAELALQNPTLAAIAAQPSADIPFAGTVPNYNRLVTQYGYSGLKPGDSDEAGVTLLFSTRYSLIGQPLHLTGVVLGGNSSYTQETAYRLMESAKTTLSTTNP